MATTVGPPIIYPCERCGARPGKPCRRPSGESMGRRTHAERGTFGVGVNGEVPRASS